MYLLDTVFTFQSKAFKALLLFLICLKNFLKLFVVFIFYIFVCNTDNTSKSSKSFPLIIFLTANDITTL